MDGVIFTPEQLRVELEYFLKQDAFVFDVETMPGQFEGTRGIPTQNRVVWLALATNGRTIVIPMGHPNGNNLLRKAYKKKNPETKKFDSFPAVFDEPPQQMRPSEVFEILRPLFFSSLAKGAHNAPFDVISIAKYYDDQIIPGPIFCTITMQWLLDENIGQSVSNGPKRPFKKDLKTLTTWYYKVKYDHNNTGKCIEIHPFKEVAAYVLADASYTWFLLKKFRQSIPVEALEAVWRLEQDVTPVVCRMGRVGAPVDLPAIQELDNYLTEMLIEIETRVYKTAKKQFNINSNPQRQEILYGFKKDGGQGLKPVKLTDGGKEKQKRGEPLTIYDYSTDKDSLEDYDNALVDVLLEYAEVSKLRSTYVRGYLGVEGDPDKPCLIFNGRIHTDLVQYGTVTGRFSSRAPNLQNIPRAATELGEKVRGLFRAPEGYKLIVSDYGQMELRILASMIGFGGLYDGFWAGIDAHTQTAALVFGVDIDNVEKWMRNAAKTLNFAIVYGAGPAKVAKMLGMSIPEAKILLANHRKAFPEIYAFKQTVISTARGRKIPHIRTIMGRVRRMWDLRGHYGEDEWKIWRAERQLFNSLIQGSLGDIIKLAMVRMDKVLSEDAVKNPGREIQMVLSVHDELVILCPDDRVEEACAYLLEAMSGEEIQSLINVPLAMTRESIGVASRWSEAK